MQTKYCSSINNHPCLVPKDIAQAMCWSWDLSLFLGRVSAPGPVPFPYWEPELHKVTSGRLDSGPARSLPVYTADPQSHCLIPHPEHCSPEWSCFPRECLSPLRGISSPRKLPETSSPWELWDLSPSKDQKPQVAIFCSIKIGLHGRF